MQNFYAFNLIVQISDIIFTGVSDTNMRSTTQYYESVAQFNIQLLQVGLGACMYVYKKKIIQLKSAHETHTNTHAHNKYFDTFLVVI